MIIEREQKAVKRYRYFLYNVSEKNRGFHIKNKVLLYGSLYLYTYSSNFNGSFIYFQVMGRNERKLYTGALFT